MAIPSWATALLVKVARAAARKGLEMLRRHAHTEWLKALAEQDALRSLALDERMRKIRETPLP